jgi:hypothetical protein
MTISIQRIPVGTVLTGRHGYVLRPDELGVTVPHESHFARQPTLGFTLFADEFKEANKGPQNCTTARTRRGDVLFAVVVAETKSYLHIGVMDVSHPGSHQAVMESAKNRAINFAVTDGKGEMRLACLSVDDAFSAVIERMTGPRESTSHLHLLQAFGYIVKDTADRSLLAQLGWGSTKKRASAHLLLPEATRASMVTDAPVTYSAGSMH